MLNHDIILIIECCKIEQDSKQIEEKISLIKDWDEFISTVYSHGVFPLVYLTLKKYEDKISSNVLNYMKSIYMDIVKYNMLLTSELINIMKLLEENNIKAIAFKGPTLSQLAYGDITLRQYVDLDILVEKEDLTKVNKINLDNNYLCTNNKLIEKSKNLEYIKDITYINIKKNVNLEIHIKLFSFYLLNNFDIFKRNQNISISNYNFKVFNINYLIVYLSIHGSRHIWERIEWIVDINRLLINQSDKIDFDEIYSIAKKLDSEISVNLAFYLCIHLFNNKDLLTKIKMTDNLIVENLTKKVLINYKSKSKISNYEIFLFHNRLFKSKLFKFYHTFQIFQINHRDLDFISLSNKLHFFYYLVKPFRILKEYLS
jgi:hypothetical protein